MKSLLILGATGSIGRSALEVVRADPGEYRVAGLAAGNNAAALAAAVREFRPACAALAANETTAELREAATSCGAKLFAGPGAAEECARACGAELCVSAIVGFAGLAPTLAAIDAGMNIALANKESLVAAGGIVMRRASARGVRLIPVDSEHSALFQCLQAGGAESVERLVITASGGPFRGWPRERLAGVTPAQALAHPTWSMGAKITVDSATLANKALETIEAHWLFGVPYEKISVLVHPQSLVHGLVEFAGGGVLAHLAPADMRIPLQYALAFPHRRPGNLPGLDFAKLAKLEFSQPDRDAFPMLALGISAGVAGGSAPAVYSAANEAAVCLFLSGKIGFNEIHTLTSGALDTIKSFNDNILDEIILADQAARAYVAENYRNVLT